MAVVDLSQEPAASTPGLPKQGLGNVVDLSSKPAAAPKPANKPVDLTSGKAEEPFKGSTYAFLDTMWNILEGMEQGYAPHPIMDKTGKLTGMAPGMGYPDIGARAAKVLVDETKGGIHAATHPWEFVKSEVGDVGPSIKEDFKQGTGLVKSGFEQQFSGKTDDHGAITNFAIGTGKEALGTLGAAISPLTGTVDALIGKPQAKVLERDMPDIYPRTIAQLLTPAGYGDIATAAFKALPAAAKVKLLGESWDTVFNPHLATPEGEEAGQVIRHEHALKNLKEEQVQQGIQEVSKETAHHNVVTKGVFGRHAMADYILGFFGDAMNFAPERVRVMFIHAMETGKMRYIPEKMRPLAVKLSQVFKENREAIEKLGVDEKVNWIEHYFPHLWKDTAAASQFAKDYIKQIMSSEGRKGFLQERSFDMFQKGIEAGLEPISTNPILITYIRNREVLRYVMANRILRGLNDRGLVKWVPRGEDHPEGFVELSDKIAKARFKDINPYKVTLHTIKEEESLGGKAHYRTTTSDEVLNEWQARNPNQRIYHTTVKRAGLEGRSVEELSDTNKGLVSTLRNRAKNEFLVPKEDLEGNLEFGIKTRGEEGEGRWMIHPEANRLMNRYFLPGLFERQDMFGAAARGIRMVSNLYNQAQLGFSLFHLGFVTLDSMASNTALVAKLISAGRYKSALRTLAETPIVPITYAKRGANLQMAYNQAVIDTIDSGSEVTSTLGGFIRGSKFNMERRFQRYMKNKTTREQSVASLEELRTQAQREAVLRKEVRPGYENEYNPTDEDMAKAVRSSWGKLSPRVQEHLQEIAQPGENIVNTLRKDASEKTHRANYGAPTPEGLGSQPDVMESLISAGALAKRPKVYSSRLTMPWQEEYRQAVKASGLGSILQRLRRGSGHGIAGTMGAIGAAEDHMMAALFQHYVPNMKLGVFISHAQSWLEAHPTATYGELSSEMGKIWDSVENRLGEMDLDRRFWNQVVKDSAVIGLRAVGWNYGTLHEIGGGTTDIAKSAIKKANVAITAKDMHAILDEGKMTYRASYIFGLMAETAALGGMLTYMNTGQAPQEMKDYFFPPDGKGGRIAPPTYAKEIYEFPMHPIDTVVGKLGPIWSNLYTTFESNQDFYGAQVYDYMDPFREKLISTMKFWGEEFMPFSFQSYERTDPYADSGKNYVQYGLSYLISPSDLGLVKAPKYVEEGEDLINKIKEKKNLRGLGRAMQEGRIKPRDEVDTDDDDAASGTH